MIPPDTEITSLSEAVRRNNVTAVKSLLEKGANLGTIDKRKRTPLHWALDEENLEIAQILVEYGADLNATDHFSQTPLHLAAMIRDDELTGQVIKKLLDKGANVNARDDVGNTPLHCIRCGKVAKILLDNGAGLDTINNRGETPLLRALRTNMISVAMLLIEYGADVNATNDKLETPLHLAAMIRDDELTGQVIKKLLDKGANINNSDIDDCTPLHRAVLIGNILSVRKLIEYGADVNETNRKLKTPLHLPDSEEVTRELLDKGANVNARDAEGNTPLHCVYCVEVAKILFNNGAGLDTMNYRDETPLLRALRKSMISVAMLLIEYGADVNATNDKLETPLHLAAILEDDELTGQVIKKLLDKGANINNSDIDDCTPLHRAVLIGNILSVRKLIEYGADVNLCALLQCAADSEYSVIIKFLLENGSDVNAEDAAGHVALDHAIDRKRTENVRLIEFHIVKLKQVGLYVSGTNLRRFSDDTFRSETDSERLNRKRRLHAHKLECGQELERINGELRTSLSLKYILTTNSPRYLEDKTLAQQLESINHNDFPIYGNLLRRKHEMDREKLTLLDRGMKALEVLLKRDKRIAQRVIPNELLERILCYLSNGDLQNLILCKQI